jgi:hypothetical protein
MSERSEKNRLAKEQSLIIKQLFDDKSYQEAISELISKRKYPDENLEQEVAKAFVERAEAGVGKHTLYIASNSEMDAHALSFMGLHHSGTPVIKDQSFIDEMMPSTLSRAMGDESSFINEDIARALLAYANDKESSPYNESTRKHLDEFITKERVEQLLSLNTTGQVEFSLTDEQIESVASEYEIEMPVYRKPEDESAKLTARALQPDVGELSSQVEKDALKHRLDVDLQTDAQMSLNKIMDENPSWAHRTMVDKLRSRIANGLTDLTNPSSLSYPSESVFGQNLSEVDDNGRVVKELLKFKQCPFKGEKCVFPSSKVPDTVYQYAAEHVKKSGIKYPHITTNHKNPQEAIHFMKSTVQALVDAGYDVEDITVGKNVRPAFDKMKAEGLFAQHAISEAPEGMRPGETPKEEEAPSAERKKMPEEILAEEREAIHESINYIKDGLESEENPMKMSDMPNEKLVSVLGLYALMNESSENWNESVREFGVSPAGRETVEKVKEHFDGLVSKCKDNPESLGRKQVETLYEARQALPEAYPQDELIPVRDVLQAYRQSLSSAPTEEVAQTPEESSDLNASEPQNKSEDPTQGSPADSSPDEHSPEPAPESEGDPDFTQEQADEPTPSADPEISQSEQEGPPAYLSDAPIDESGYIPELDEDQEQGYEPPVESTSSSPKDNDELGEIPSEDAFDILDHSVEHTENVEPESTVDNSWGDDFAGFNPEVDDWKNIIEVDWDSLTENDVALISNLSPADRIELSQMDSPKMISAGLSQEKAERLALNIRQVDMLISADKETIEDLSQSEVELLSKIPDDQLGEHHKNKLEPSRPEAEQDEPEQRSSLKR